MATETRGTAYTIEGIPFFGYFVFLTLKSPDFFLFFQQFFFRFV